MHNAKIEEALKPLIGLRWWSIGRASYLLWLHFGEKREVPAWGGGTKTVGQWAIHAECSWSLRHSGLVIVGSEDYRVDSGGSAVADAYDRLAQSRFDDIAERLRLEFESGAPTASEIAGDGHGGFSLKMSDGYGLNISVRADGGSWRIFQPSTDQRHFVVER